jgi:nitrite reductase/ring-hydroxylating ferredoxin subunit
MTLATEDGTSVTTDSTELEPNEFRVAEVPAGRAIRLGEVAVFNVDGTFYGTQAQCTHMGGPLCEGKLEGSIVTCPFHGARFDVKTGAVLRGPATQQLELYVVCVKDGIGRIDIDLGEWA